MPRYARILFDNRAALVSKARRAAESQLEASSRRILDGSLARVPIRRGVLLRSSQILRGPLARVVWFRAFYAGFVELGTRRMRARPYLLPSFLAEVPRFIAGLRSRLR